MKQGRTIQDLAQELMRQQSTKRDVVADTRLLTMAEGGDLLRVAGQGDFSVSAHTHGQIAQRLDIPKKYYDRMRSEAPALLEQNVNQWFQTKPEKRMVRTLDGVARAFLSDRYRRLDNLDLASAILPVIGEFGGLVIESCEVTESRMYLKVAYPQLEREVKKGDVVQAGFLVSNSEIGQGSLEVAPFVKRLVCLNGMKVDEFGQKRYHMGRAQGDNEAAVELYRDETLIADDRAFFMKVADTVRGVLQPARFDKIVARMRESAEQKLEGSPVAAVEVLADRFGLVEAEKNSVLRHLISGGDLSAFGLVQAVTEASKEVASYDRATDLEAFGGQIITLGKDEWKEIAIAA
jgi:hypothetical protein